MTQLHKYNLHDYIFCQKPSWVAGETSFEEKMAYITHYIHNRNTQFEKKYQRGAELLNELLGRPLETKITDADCCEFLSGTERKFPSQTSPKFSFIDLFAGIGGFRLAMQSLGGKCVFSSEFNPKAQKTYSYNYGEVPFGDITKRETKEVIPDNFDVICGGFPCQAFSIAGYRKGFEDTRGTLFFDVAEIIKTHKPKVAFLENVRNLEGHDNGRTFEIIRNTLMELGYSVYHKVLNSALYGNIPQHRERIIIVAFNNDNVPNHATFCFPEPIKLTKTIHDCIDHAIQPEKYYYRETQIYYPQLLKDMLSQDTVYQWRRVYCRGNKSNLCPTPVSYTN
ncbi:MAG: DNA (cytosine-5-)-methyltransferase, partial [Odoribacter sp.]|nr:DNA (cytosine-5-)-methyltransferase [Odoribacter sp.]